ncbi:MAG: hypothetical protein JM58_03655 [Peptococcaceae bacterium BICA1-8]|nr:MAG: hypothetical protein JM58_03655 [Peptococcaceae bacterium BICA1-8]
MKFGEKLDLLMKITDTSNIALARNVSLDASFVSRLRRGVRTPAKNENYIMAMAAYFARNCSQEYQKAALSEELKVSLKNLSANLEEVTRLIYKWFLAEKADDTKAIKSFVDNIARFKFKKPPRIPAVDDLKINESITSDMEVFYGIEGKQNAVIAFFSLILKNKTPQTLLLYSDENMDWLTENPEFTAKWATLFFQVTMRGNKIKIIHSVTRSLEELFAAVKEWLPIYMTGAIEPYYYPKIRDRVFKRTLFIAPNTVAVTSNSIGDETRNAANFLYTDKNTITALSQEYKNFLSLCQPLMRIFTPESKEGFLSILSEFDNEEADSIVKTDVLSNITMPIDVAESILSRMDSNNKDQVLAYQEMRIKKFEESLQKQQFTEIITIPDLKKIRSGQIMLNFSDIFGDTALFFTQGEFSRHLQNIIRLLKTFDSYNVYLITAPETAGPMIYAKEDVGVIFGKTSPPSVVFATNENNMSAAFWEYVSFFLHKEARGKSQKKGSIEKLEKIVTAIEINSRQCF